MLMLGFGAVAAIAVGIAMGGRLGALAQLRLRAPLLLVGAVLTQAGMALLVPGQRRPGIILAFAMVGAWLVVNIRHLRGPVGAGLSVVAVGWMLNAAPVALNGAMPVSSRALQAVGAPATTAVSEGHLYKHMPADSHTALAPLGDVVPVRALSSVVSPGDLVMVVGVMLVIILSMTGASPSGRLVDLDHRLDVLAEEPPPAADLDARYPTFAGPAADRPRGKPGESRRLLGTQIGPGIFRSHSTVPPVNGKPAALRPRPPSRSTPIVVAAYRRARQPEASPVPPDD